MKRGLGLGLEDKVPDAKPLSEREKRGNKTRSKVRARVERVFGAHTKDQSNDMGGTLVHSIGLHGGGRGSG